MAPKGKGKPPGPAPKKKGPSYESVPEPKRPVIVPQADMKRLRWEPLRQHDLGAISTIWDTVCDVPDELLPVEELVTLFSKLPSHAGAGRRATWTPRDVDTSLAQTKELQIIGCWERPGKEGALRRLPPATSVAEALETFDEKLLRKKKKQNCGDGDCTTGAKEDAPGATEDLLKLILDSVCPTAAQHEQLKEAKKSNPGLILGNIEAYMWEICQVAFYRERLECWLYCHTWEAELRPVKDNVKKFQEIMKCFRSEGLSTLLGLILAVGNYLNGNTAAGRADGFRLDLLKSGRLDGLRDNESSDLRRFVIRIFLEKFRTEAIVLLKDFRPAFENVKRTLEPFEGGLKMHKNIKISLEKACDEALAVRRAELDARREKFQKIRQSEGDAQAVWLHEALDRAQERIDDLQRCRDRAAQEYSELLQWMTFLAPPRNIDNTPRQSLAGIEENKRRTDAFFMLWDDFLIPKERFENQPPQLVRNRLKSAFCDGGEIDVYRFAALWNVEVGGLSQARASSATPRAKSPRARSLSNVRLNFNVTGPTGHDANAQSDSREAQVTTRTTPFRDSNLPPLPKPFHQLERQTFDNSTSRGRSRERDEAERRIEPITNRAVTFDQMVESLEGEQLDPKQLEEHWKNMKPAIIVFAEPRVPQVSDQRPLQACSSSDKSKELQETATSNEVLAESLANPLSLTSVRPADGPQCSGSEKVPEHKEDSRPPQLTLFAPPQRAVRGPSRGPPQRAVGAPSCGPPQRVPKLSIGQAICQKDSPEMPEQTTEAPRSADLFENLPTPTRGMVVQHQPQSPEAASRPNKIICSRPS